MPEITGDISISEEGMVFKFSRSSGPGGQNVNKVNSRVTLLFDVVNAVEFSDSQKRQILSRLASRVNKDGLIRVVSQKYRTQKANRRAAIERLCELLRGALASEAVRKKTKLPYAAKEKRLEEKKRRGALKRQRAEKSFEY
jgi:ribosome-associated protein